MTAIYATAAGGRAVEQRYREILRLWPVPSERLWLARAVPHAMVRPLPELATSCWDSLEWSSISS